LAGQAARPRRTSARSVPRVGRRPPEDRLPAEQRLYAAYHADAAGPGIATILAITRRMLSRTDFLVR